MPCGTWDNWCKSYTFVVARPLDYKVHIVANYLLPVTEKGYEKNNLLACEWREHKRALGVCCCVDDLSHKSCTLLKINLDLMMPSLVFFMVDQMIKLNICYMYMYAN